MCVWWGWGSGEFDEGGGMGRLFYYYFFNNTITHNFLLYILELKEQLLKYKSYILNKLVIYVIYTHTQILLLLLLFVPVGIEACYKFVMFHFTKLFCSQYFNILIRLWFLYLCCDDTCVCLHGTSCWKKITQCV